MYLIKKITYIFIFCFFANAYAQSVKVIDKTTKTPIPGVAVFNKNQTTTEVTDEDGLVNLDKFLDTELIFFQHISFNLKSLKKENIKTDYIYLESNQLGLDEVIISASNFKQNKREIPKSIAIVNADQIKFNNPQTSADLLENTGKVYIQKSQLGGGSPMIRGFSTNRLLISIDGVRMNNAIFRGGNLQNVISIDPLSIEKTEVILGAGSTIYGSDAIGGVMSFYTKRPKLSYTDSLIVDSNVMLRYATANQEKTAHVDVNLGLKKWGFLTNVTYTDFNDLRMGSHGPAEYLRPEYVVTENNQDVIIENNNPKIQKFTGYNQINLMQKVAYKPKDNLDFDLGLFYTTTSDYPRYDRLIRYRGDNLRSAEWNYGPQRWFMSNLKVTKTSSKATFYDNIKATFAYQNFEESRIDRDFEDIIRNIHEESVNALSFNLDLEKDLSKKSSLFYGFEYVFNKVNSIGYTENIEDNTTGNTVSRYPDGATWKSTAIYANYKYKPNQKFVLQSGLRYNNVTQSANFTANNQYLNLPFDQSKINADALTASTGITWLPNDILQWKLNLSTAFRAPNIDDVGKVFDSEPGSVVVPNNNLKPEYAYNGELGLKLNFNKKVVFDLATYYTYLDNALVRRDGDLNGETEIIYNNELSNVQSIQNASKSWIYGFEFAALWNISDQLKLTSRYNFIGGTEETDGIEVPVRHVAPNFGDTHLMWQSDKFKLDGFVNYNNKLSFTQLAPSETEKDYIYALDENGNPYSPSWYTLNLRTQYQLAEDTIVTATLENITDQRYKTYSSGIAAPGRNLIVSLTYSL
ncbi:TonB-dependent receptor [Mesoflavibacter zeaxanthinifaciens subsp. sabulilitoris]|uniref:TonB-dependent receptor n=2 Tax=Mesoflavibacter TaxID=444051 RepID=A0A2T1NI64_9FLAO|nr:TonB-dependent receptor [Mesoflavibacter sp.]PSG92526.1 TonB-dependent receptor [Mesoflavibacter zeaxanthinifaciens subsp. sabulilitoris]